jgi:shikimate dehydrogenase
MNLFGLIGYPLTHSFSKKYFTEKYEREGIKDCKYELFEMKDVSEVMNVIRNNSNLKGLNVTIPHKEAVMQFLDELDEPVKKIKAVNVIKIKNGKLKGYNSDYHGFRTSLINFLKEGNAIASSTRALVLGTGGASKAVKAALEDLKIEYKTVSRNKGQADLTYSEIDNEVIESHKLIINTTPLGMYPHVDACPDLPYEKMNKDYFLFDLVYNPEETLFMRKGKAQGARTKNGMEMLILQAEKAWEIWNS